jgi:BlaI family transcriptional regulator, penicillinase repressor
MADMRDLPQAEFDVMEVLWDKDRATVKEIHSALSRKRKLAYTTVATLLTRLREKGYVAAEAENFAYVFSPLIKRENVVHRKLDDLVKRVLGGSLAPLAAYIAENGKLTPEQIEALADMVKSEASEEVRMNGLH